MPQFETQDPHAPLGPRGWPVRFLPIALTLSLGCSWLLPAVARGQSSESSRLEGAALPAYDISPTGFTVECWLRVRSKPGFDPVLLVCWRDEPGPSERTSLIAWQLGICNLSACEPGALSFGIMSGKVQVRVDSPRRVDDGRYHHVAATYDGARLRLYVDGEASGSTKVRDLQVRVGGGKLVAGNNWEARNPFDGEIDELRIWNRCRTQAEIRGAMGAPIGRVPPALAGYWPFDGDARDRSAAQNDLVPEGHVVFRPGRIDRAVEILNVDPLHGSLRRPPADAAARALGISTPVPRRDESRPVERMGALAARATAPQLLEAGLLDRRSGVEPGAETRRVQPLHPALGGAIVR